MATSFPASQAIVVGGGLAGMSAANTVLEHGGKVILLDKSSFCGGNSTKATSGINGAATKTQKMKGIEDSVALFTNDTLKGGAKKPDVVKVLCENSGPDVDWLVDKFSLDLSLVARLGGHSAPRTHRGKERFPGMTITYALIQMLEKIAERTNKARIVTKARAKELLTNPSGACIGLVYEKNGLDFQEHGPVILATGGFGADFTSDSLLAQYRPDLMHLPTTNGEHCTGDGIKMGEAIGGKSIDLEWVQVHPTGLVKPDDPDAKIKFLAAEALRGVGGLVIDASGKRFCNELGRRDYVTGEMWKNKPPFRLCLNKAASEEIIWHCKHYTGRGVMKFYPSGEHLAEDMDIDVAVLEATHDAHYQAAKKTEKDPDGGSWPAYPSGKSWDECSGKTGSGKKFYHNTIPGSSVKTEPFYVAIITPVIHYCMGGLEIDTDSAVVAGNGKAIPGLYAAGEVAGGVHGNNRLGGNSLLDCVVFGRVAGKACCQYMLGDKMKDVSLFELSGGGLTGDVQSSKFSGGSYEDNMNKGSDAQAVAPTGVIGGYSLDEVAKHTTKTDCWVVVHGQVLDVTKFLGEHPGGELAILTFAGKDATEEFAMIHPPDVIPKYAPHAVIGKVGAGAPSSVPAPVGSGSAAAPLLDKDGHKVRDWSRSEGSRKARMAAQGKVPGWLGSVIYMALGFLKEVLFTILPQKNVVFTNDRSGLTRSAMFLFLFIIIHAVGNLHVFLGAPDFNGYGYFYVRLYWTGFGLEANIVEEYILLAALLHVCVALKRTWDISINYTVASGKLNLAFSGVALLLFMTVHLFQFRFGVTEQYYLCPPPYLINFFTVAHWPPALNLFWTPEQDAYTGDCDLKSGQGLVGVRDIYKLEFDVFQSFGWCLCYIGAVAIFSVHMCLGWQKVVPSPQMGIPKRYHQKAVHWGYAMTAFIALVYASFPIYAHNTAPMKGNVQPF